jgi:hypothetical protein
MIKSIKKQLTKKHQPNTIVIRLDPGVDLINPGQPRKVKKKLEF